MATYEIKNAQMALGTAYATAHTCPAGKTALVIGCNVTNVDLSTTYKFTGRWADSSNVNTTKSIGEGTPIDAGATYGPIIGKLGLEAGDYIEAKADTAGKLEMTLTLLVITP